MGRGLKYAATIFPLGIDFPDFKDVTAIRAEPAALQTVEFRLTLQWCDRLLCRRRRSRLRSGLLPVEDKKGRGNMTPTV